jgi:hypothetical protein
MFHLRACVGRPAAEFSLRRGRLMTDDEFSAAMAEAGRNPLLPEQLPGVPDNPETAARFLRAIAERMRNRAGPQVMARIAESFEDTRCGKDGMEPFEVD